MLGLAGNALATMGDQESQANERSSVASELRFRAAGHPHNELANGPVLVGRSAECAAASRRAAQRRHRCHVRVSKRVGSRRRRTAPAGAMRSDGRKEDRASSAWASGIFTMSS